MSDSSANDEVFRSFLFVPATGGRKLEKAFSSAADAVIVDLEDAVALSEKEAARQLLRGILDTPSRLPTYVRVNSLATPFCFDDLMAVAKIGVRGVILPKVETDHDLQVASWLLAQAERQNDVAPDTIEMLPIIETAKGLARVGDIARSAPPRTARIVFGAVDLALDMDLDLDNQVGAQAQARFAIALASRVAGLGSPVDTAFIRVDDVDGLRTSSEQARSMGYSGKCCIHPKQIDTVNAVFSPTDDQVNRARRIVDTFERAERSGAGAVSLDGEMINYPVVDKARRTLAAAKARQGSR